MKYNKIWRWFILLALSISMFMAFSLAARASPPSPDPQFQTEIAGTHHENNSKLIRLNDAGETLEVFTNTWSYSTLGLVYNPSQNQLRYVHESQSSSSNPTIYDVDYYPTHTVQLSLALSALNVGWPWQIDNRTGAGYNADTGTYFLADYNGDLSNADDNIVEINHAGTIINAWEIDDEVGSNDSSDGSEIDSIIDIAVVPGNPTRYFVTAAYDQAIVYEVVLTKTGVFWTPNSWATVMTYTNSVADTFSDNLGIDYDAQNKVLYHSGWHTTTILVTDLDMNAVTSFTATFDCPGAGGYNSGVTFIEGSEPPEIWVTDFTSDKTTRCEAVGHAPAEIEWDKWIDDQPWDPDWSYSRETSDTIKIVDVITATPPVQLMERWNPERLDLINYMTEPNVGQIVNGPHFLEWNIPPVQDVVTMTKWFHVEPSTWTTTLISETLWALNGDLIAERPVTVVKQLPELHLASNYHSQATAGSATSYTLSYENSGGYENDVEIRSYFPITAPFLYADPYPTHINGNIVSWELGDLSNGTTDQIEVILGIDASVKQTQTVVIENEILNHVDEPGAPPVQVIYDIEEPPDFAWEWEKLVLVNGKPWNPELPVTVETSNTIKVIDTISTSTTGTQLVESWDPRRLEFLGVDFEGGYVSPTPESGHLIWEVPEGDLFTITKTFRVSPCTWLNTVLWEELWIDGWEADRRPVGFKKTPSKLWINSDYEPSVAPGTEATFVLNYGNKGGYENDAWIRNTFPAEANFLRYEAEPPVVSSSADPQGRWAEWGVGSLADGETGVITVTVEISPNLPIGELPPIYDYIYDHADIERDWTEINFYVRPPQWEKRINGIEWYPGISVTGETSDTFTVVDIITGAFDRNLNEFWNPERLELLSFEATAGEIITHEGGLLEWLVPHNAAPVITLTKQFQLLDCAWTHSPIHEELWIKGDFWRERPFLVYKEPAELQITTDYEPEVFAGERVTYTLHYSNTGGYESGAWITSTFPISAPLVSAEPPPNEQSAQGRWAKWNIGVLETNDGGTITISIALTETLLPYHIVHTHNYAYDHVDIERVWHPISYTIQPVEPIWEKEIWIGEEGPFTPEDSPYQTPPDDPITIIDRIHVTAGAPISYTLTEGWSDILSLTGLAATSGDIMTTAQTIAWEGRELAANSWYVLTKTFHVVGSDWITAPLTETLSVARADPEVFAPILLEFEYTDQYIYLPLVLRNYGP